MKVSLLAKALIVAAIVAYAVLVCIIAVLVCKWHLGAAFGFVWFAGTIYEPFVRWSGMRIGLRVDLPHIPTSYFEYRPGRFVVRGHGSQEEPE